MRVCPMDEEHKTCGRVLNGNSSFRLTKIDISTYCGMGMAHRLI